MGNANVAKPQHFYGGTSWLRMATVNLYPRSLARLVVLGNVLVALPLMAAIGYSAVTVQALSERSKAVTGQAALAGRLGWELPEDLIHMERSLRQYEVLRDASLLEDYGVARREWRQIGTDFAAIPLMAPVAPQVAEILATEEAAYRQLGSRAEGLDQLRATVAEVMASSRVLLTEANRLVSAEQEAFHAQAESLRRRLLAALVAALTTAAALLWAGRRLMGQLFSRFERAVLALGEGRLERTIRLKGPEDLQRIGRRLEWLRGRLAALEEQRTLLLRHVSHELKTPLAALREGASLLSEGAAGALTPPQARIAGIMQNNTLRLQALIDSLLQLQRAAHVADRFEPQQVRLDELIQQTLSSHQLAARDKRLHVVGTLAPLAVEGGREELMAVVDNLIANAIKYSSEGGTVRVSLARSSDDAVFEVADDGPGIPAADRQRIFEPFFRSAATRDATGVGLGLAIANEYAVAHRGRIELLESPVGAHFRVTLPLVWRTK